MGSNATLIAKSSRIEGKLGSSGDITVEGEVKGTIEASGLLLIAENGKVEASIHGRSVTIAGKVNGDITADERIELDPAAEVQGNITAPRILIKDGATFEGQVFMKSPARPKPSGAGNQGGPQGPVGNARKAGKNRDPKRT